MGSPGGANRKAYLGPRAGAWPGVLGRGDLENLSEQDTCVSEAHTDELYVPSPTQVVPYRNQQACMHITFPWESVTCTFPGHTPRGSDSVGLQRVQVHVSAITSENSEAPGSLTDI